MDWELRSAVELEGGGGVTKKLGLCVGDWGDKFLVGLVHSWDLKNFLGLSGERAGRGQGLSIFIDLHMKLVKHEKKGEMHIPPQIEICGENMRILPRKLAIPVTELWVHPSSP